MSPRRGRNDAIAFLLFLLFLRLSRVPRVRMLASPEKELLLLCVGVESCKGARESSGKPKGRPSLPSSSFRRCFAFGFMLLRLRASIPGLSAPTALRRAPTARAEQCDAASRSSYPPFTGVAAYFKAPPAFLRLRQRWWPESQVFCSAEWRRGSKPSWLKISRSWRSPMTPKSGESPR